MYLEAKAALLAKLTGQPVAELALRLRDGLKSSMRDPARSRAADQQVGNLVWPDRDKDIMQDVTVFPFDIAGAGFNIYPAVSVALYDYKPARQNQLHRDPIVRPVPGTKRSITFDDGEVVEGYTLIDLQPHPLPVTVVFQIRAYARTDSELVFLTDRLIDLLDNPRMLEVTYSSGETTSFDTWIEEPAAPIAVPGALLQSPELREYSQVITYRVEAFRDTTQNLTRARTITRTGIYIEDADDPGYRIDILDDNGTIE